MQVCEMRVLRTLFSQREILNLTRNRSVTSPTVVFSNFGQNRSSSCDFRYSRRKTIHSSNILHRHREDSSFDADDHRSWSGSNPSAEEPYSSCRDESPSFRTVYDPSVDKLVTMRVVEGHEIREQKSSCEGENRASLSTFDSVEENFSPERSVLGAEKMKDERKSWSFFRVKEENSVQKKSNSGVDNTKGEEKHSVSSTSDSSARDFASKKKKSKSKVDWMCSNCGDSFGQWWGVCRSCGSGGTLKEFSRTDAVEKKIRGFDVSENSVRSWLPQKPGELHPQRLTDVNKGINELNWRIPLSGLFGLEVARVLGGGLVPGSLILIGGDPGVGKSTLLLQIAALIAEGHNFGGPAPVIYVSGEESVEQIGNRADRMRIGTGELFLYSSTDIEDILEKIQPLYPRALIVDSIQTVYLRGVTGSAGGLQQVKECTSALLHFAKRIGIPVLLIGHVTKTGDIAGPRVLEHIVDVVLYMEGEKYSSHRFLRSVKNRFGSTDELGVFEMSQLGLEAVSNPSEIFLSEQHSGSDILAGLAVAVIIDGSRTFLIEIQVDMVFDILGVVEQDSCCQPQLGGALCLSGPTVERQFNGVQASRAGMIIAVLMKQAGLKLQDNAIFLNVVSGVKVTETAGDLAIAAAICSSFLEFPIPNNVAFIGEIGLGGELRAIPRMEKRINALAKLGYKKCIVPKSTEKLKGVLNLEGMMLLGCRDMKEVIHTVFTSD